MSYLSAAPVIPSLPTVSHNVSPDVSPDILEFARVSLEEYYLVQESAYMHFESVTPSPLSQFNEDADDGLPFDWADVTLDDFEPVEF